MADLERVGWAPPLRFKGLPPHVFAEYRRMPGGALAVHLVNYDPAHPVAGASVEIPDGMKVTFEEPFGAEPSAKPLASGAQMPPFAFYALITASLVDR